ncbi:hypothetical protein HCH_03778 [Hahella chejuensis KCTC 2396]|uniref:Uncharacterized protein n=1 Tax=Hahella chejuensis (strain KCTC 2396) TaxID=349521 RepID=Q2SFR4_HAHCH|nr:hypothetical protein [Hahella chejuensis]ABC30510.1 hypothetical protein HCH_03778 [Hahella chejuensis KCTC 2396]
MKKDLNVEVFVVSEDDLASTIKIIIKYIDVPVSSVAETIKRKISICNVRLKASEFYCGLRLVYEMVNELKESGVEIELHVNGEQYGPDFLELLKIDIENIERKDIY